MKLEEAIIMLALHSKQVEEWSDYILSNPMFKKWARHQAKFAVSQAKVSCRALNNG
jgi:hypothetical protein